MSASPNAVPVSFGFRNPLTGERLPTLPPSPPSTPRTQAWGFVPSQPRQQSNEPFEVSPPVNQTIAAGSRVGLIIDDQDRVWMFENYQVTQPSRGQLKQVTGVPPIVSVSADGDHALMLDNRGRVYVLGRPIPNMEPNSRHPINPQTDVILVEGLPRIVAIAAGLSDLALDINGGVWIFRGFPKYGETELSPPGRYREDVLTNIARISVYGNTRIFLTKDGRIYTEGLSVDRFSGQLTSPLEQIAMADPVKDISAGSDFKFFITNDNKVYGIGTNKDGVLGSQQGYAVRQRGFFPAPTLMHLDRQISTISSGNDYALFLSSDGIPFARGYNFYGQLGLNNRDNTQHIYEVGLDRIVAISAGTNRSLFLNDNGAVFISGNNNYVAPGDDPQNMRNRPIPIPGIRVKLPTPAVTRTTETATMTSYPLIKRMFEEERIVDFARRPNEFLEFIDSEGNEFIAHTGYNVDEDAVYPPVKSDEVEFYDILTQNISEAEIRPEIYEDENGNVAVTFVDPTTQKYLIRVYQDPQTGEIFAPIVPLENAEEDIE